jgi:molybdopterin biosynthesis enzyme
MLEQLKALLGAGHTFTDDQVEVALALAVSEVETYCRRALDAELEAVAVQIAIIKLNRLGTEGVAALSYSGVSESYADGYPVNIQAILNSKRKLKVLG